MLHVVLTQRAEISLEEIADYCLTEFTAERAVKVVDSIEKTLTQIARNPKSFPMCFDIAEPQEATRQAIVGSTFKIVYRIKKERIEVLEIFHGSRNPELLREIK